MNKILILILLFIIYICIFIGLAKPIAEIVPNTTIKFTVPTTFNNDFLSNKSTTSEWNKINAELTLGSNQTVILNWQGFGGSVAMAREHISAINTAVKNKKTVIINVIGFSGSMHAYVLCAAPIVHYKPSYPLLFHVEIKGFMQTKATWATSQLHDLVAQCRKKGYINKIDEEFLWDGFDVIKQFNTSTYKI